MGNGLASFATGFGGGYLNAQRQSKLDEERQADRAMRQQEFDARMGEVNDKKNLGLSLADAVRPVTVESGAGGMIRPETMDNRDVGLAENASQPNGGLSLSQYRVKDKSYDTPALADIAAAAQNTPEAIDKRLGLAWATNGKPLEAKQYAAAAVTQKSGEMDLADKVWRRKIGVAMRQPGDTLHDGLATLFTESEFGPMAGKKLKAVASTDRKTVNYNMINPDGTLTPTDLTFSNDQEGVTKAGYALDGVVKPEDRYTNLVTERKAAAQQAKDAAVFDETKRHNLAVEGGAAAGKVPPGYRKTVDGNLEPIPGGPATTKGKPLAGAVLKQLQEVRDNATTIGNLQTSFKDEFAGNGVFGLGAEASMGAKAVLGADKDSVAWWKDYRKQAELVERHSMFGASLTPGEQASWRSADIGPGMDKEVIKTNLATRAALTKKIHDNSRQDFIDAGHSEERINSISSRGATSNVPLSMPKTIADMKPGGIYQTGRGPAKWNGTAFEVQ